jgi:hypothetical protein
MLDWIRDFALEEGKVTEADLKLMHVTDSPAEVVRIISESQSSLREVENDLIAVQSRAADDR